MKTPFPILTGLAFLVILVQPSLSSGTMITYSGGAHQKVMVMDETGSSPTVLHRGSKFSPFSAHPSISPPLLDGTAWIAFTDTDVDQGAGAALYRVRTDGSGLTKVLCGGGTYGDGEFYGSVGDQKWSPDGSQIAVHWGDHIFLVPAGSEVGLGAVDDACTSTDLQRIYTYELDPETGEGWTMVGNTAWNYNGTQIAGIEVHEPRPEVGDDDVRLVVFEHQSTGWVVLRTVDTDADIYGRYAWDLDWQRGPDGNLLTFTTWEGQGPGQSVRWINWIHSESGNWGHLAEGGGASWSPDNTQLIFTNSRNKLVKWDYPNGPGEVVGSGGTPDWQRNPLVITCDNGDDCDDSNPCTDDACNGGLCESTANSAPCNDANPCTDPDFCSGGECTGLAIDGVYNEDCGGWCCEGECAAGVNSCECLPKGEICTENAECCSGQCHPRKGTCK